MHNIVISDTSSLIIFEKIDQLDLLNKLYSNITVTPEVVIEYQDQIPDWINVISVKDKKYQEFLETQVDRGEASSIALAMELEDSLLLLDDLKARKLAKRLNLKFTGALGVITKAKQEGFLSEVKPLLDKLILTNFRISDVILNEILRINDEM